jgi:hypothetical protein
VKYQVNCECVNHGECLCGNQLEVGYANTQLDVLKVLHRPPQRGQVARVTLVKSIVEISVIFNLVTFNYSIKFLLSPPLSRTLLLDDKDMTLDLGSIIEYTIKGGRGSHSWDRA